MFRRSRGSPPARRVPLRGARRAVRPARYESSGSARRGTRPGGGNSAAPNRAGYAGVRARPTNLVRPRRHTASLFVDRARIGPANRHVPAQPRIAAGPPCAPTRRPPSGPATRGTNRLLARRGTRPGGGNSAAPKRAGYAGVRARPTNLVQPRRHTASLFVDRARIGPANRHVPAQPRIAAGPPCAPTRRRRAVRPAGAIVWFGA